MLQQIEPTKTLDLNQDNPSFNLNTKSKCDLFVHVYRKGTKNEHKNCYVNLNHNCDCTSDFMVQVECSYYEEWHETSYNDRKVTLSQHVFCAHDGVWCIDVYEEFEHLDPCCEEIDPSNYYRTINTGSTKTGKKLCDQYEFYIGKPCSSEAEVCKTTTMD